MVRMAFYIFYIIIVPFSPQRMHHANKKDYDYDDNGYHTWLIRVTNIGKYF
jgi:hypothetical protein